MQNDLERKNMYFDKKFCKIYLVWACLLHKDLSKLKSSTEENTYLGVSGFCLTGPGSESYAQYVQLSGVFLRLP